MSEVHSNKILIRSTPSQIEFIEQQKLGRVKEVPIFLTTCIVQCSLRRLQLLTIKTKKVGFGRSQGGYKMLFMTCTWTLFDKVAGE